MPASDPVRPLVLSGARPWLTDGPGEPADIVVEGERIAAVGRGLRPEGAVVIDLAGRVVLPGLFDTHVHLVAHDADPVERMRGLTACGVTTVRDLGILGSLPTEAFFDLLGRSTHPRFPRVSAAGRIVATPDGYGHRTPDGNLVGAVVTSPAEAVRVVDAQFGMGAGGVKIGIDSGPDPAAPHPAMPTAVIAAIVAEVARAGRWLGAHVVESRWLDVLVRAGVREAVHVPSDPIPDELLDVMAEVGFTLTPTLTIWEHRRDRLGDRPAIDAADNVRRYRARGGRITVGTDYMRGRPSAPVAEMALLRDAGLSTIEVVAAATSEAAAALGLGQVTGRIAPGMSADLLVVEGIDDRFEQLRRPVLVVNRGAVVDRPGSPPPHLTEKSARWTPNGP